VHQIKRYSLLTVIPWMIALMWFMSRPASATTCTIPYTFTAGTSAVAAQVNNNFSNLQSCGNNIDYNNIGTSGIYASQVIPTTGAQATFGGSQNYTFSNGLTTTTLNASGTVTSTSSGTPFMAGVSGTAVQSGLLWGTSAGGYTTGGIGASNSLAVAGITGNNALITANPGYGTVAIDYGGDMGIRAAVAANGSFTTLAGTMNQTVSGTTYTLPFDAQSASGSTDTHFEHGDLAVSSIGISATTCVTGYNVTFTKAFSATPTITLVPNVISGRGEYSTAYVLSSNATGFAIQICNPSSTGINTPAYISWIALGE